MNTKLPTTLLLLVAACSKVEPSPTKGPAASRPSPTETQSLERVDAAPTDTCRAQEFTKSIVSCCGGSEFYWDGQQCVDALRAGKCGCVCSGPDCGKTFVTLEDCTTHYTDCPSP